LGRLTFWWTGGDLNPNQTGDITRQSLFSLFSDAATAWLAGTMCFSIKEALADKHQNNKTKKAHANRLVKKP